MDYFDWTSPDEELPPFDQYVLIRFKPLSQFNKQRIAVGYRSGTEKWWEWVWPNPYSTYDFDDRKQVTAWRVLP